LTVTYTFTHPADDTGPSYSASVVSPTKLPMADACRLAADEMAGVWPKTAVENELVYEQPTADPAADVARIVASYSGCGRCHLSARRTLVSGVKGDPRATVLCVGDGPGYHENSRGVPFVGPAGRLQEELFREFDIDPFSVAWMDTLGCRPVDDQWNPVRPPKRGELLACSARAWGLFATIRPRVVVCFGKEATAVFWDEPPKDVWSWHRIAPPDAPDDWVMVGYARHPRYLAKVIGMPSNYKEFAAARTFYGMLREQLPSLTKVSAWRLGLRYLSGFSAPVVTA